MAYRGFTSIDYASMDLATRITDLVVTGYRDLVVDILRSSNVEHIVASITLAHHLLVEPNIDSFGGLAVLSKTDLEAIDKVKNTEIGVFLYHLAYSLGVSTTVAVPRRYHRRCIDEYLESSDINELRKIVFRVKEEVAGMSLENIRDTIDNVRSELQEIARNAVQVSREIANKHMHKTRKASHILGVIAQIPLSYITIAEAGLLSPLLVTILQAIVSTTTQKIIDRIARSFWREQLVQLTPYNPVILSIYK